MLISFIEELQRGKGEQGILQKADFIECGDDNIDRPSEYFLPDALYSVSYDIVALMSQRFNCDRGPMQEYFDNMKEDVKQRIVFYEAVMEYTGCKEDTVDEIFKAYEKCLYDKQKDENVVETNKDGKADIYLYNGLSGIFLFFEAMWQREYKDAYYSVVEQLKKQLFEHTDTLIQDDSSHPNDRMGLFDGEASVAFTYWIMYKLTAEESYIVYAKKRILRISIEIR